MFGNFLNPSFIVDELRNDLFSTFGQLVLKQTHDFFEKTTPLGRAYGQAQFAIACGRAGCLLGAIVAEFLDALQDGVAVAVEGSLELRIVVDDLVEELGDVVVDDVVFVAQFLFGGEDDLPAHAEFLDGHRHGVVELGVVGVKHADLLHLVGPVGDVGAVNEGARMLERPGGLGLVVGVVQHQRVFVGVVEIA